MVAYLVRLCYPYYMLPIVAITVWYNPQSLGDTKAVAYIQSYAKRCETVYIVDNSDSDNSHLAATIKNSVYLPNHKNLGIATALNQGCERALADGFTWAMTMDQDSHFDEEELDRYLQLIEQYISLDETVKSFAPEQKNIDKPILPVTTWVKHRMLIPILTKVFGNTLRKHTNATPDVAYKNAVIASANVINLHTWAAVGKFDDALFIDEVDFDFCVRLRAAGFQIILFSTCSVNHTLGQKKRTFFPKIQYESDFRLFYIFRNLLIENKRYGNLSFVRNYKKELRQYFCDYCIKDLRGISHFIIFIRAYKAYRQFIKNDVVCLQKELPVQKAQEQNNTASS